MNPKVKKTLKIATIGFAIIGVLVCALFFYFYLDDRAKEKAQLAAVGEDVTMLSHVYTGTATRFGLVYKQASHEGENVVLKHYLMQVLAKNPAADGKSTLLVIGYRQLKADVGAKIENDEIDVAKFAENATLDMLVDKASANWNLMAASLKKDGSDWKLDTSADLPSMYSPSEKGPEITFPALSDKAGTFAVAEDSDAVEYFAVADQKAIRVLYANNGVDDLDDCEKYQAAKKAQPEAPAPSNNAQDEQADKQSNPDANSADANADNPSSQQAGDNADIEDEPEEETEFVCARAHATLRVLPKVTNHFHEIEVSVEGEGVEHKHQQRRYVLQYSSKDQQYGFHHAGVKGEDLQTDYMMDFVGTLNPVQ